MAKRTRRSSLEVAREKRELLQERLRIQQLEAGLRLYEAGKGTSQRPKRGSGASGDSVMAAAGNRLRETARYLEENDGITAGVLDDLVNNVVGTGVQVEPMARLAGGEPAEALNASLAELWEEWHERPDITGEFPGTEVERLVARTWLRDGEVFIQHVDGLRAPHRSSVPYSLELLEPDFVPMDMVPRGTSNTIIHGVETDDWGRRLAYHVYLRHPGNTLAGFGSSAFAQSLLQTKRVPAERMLHVRFTRRLHQTRGVPVMHAAINTLYDLKDAWESERVAMRVAAAFTAYVRKSPDYQTTAVDDTTGARNLELAPGMIWDSLMPGEEVGTIGHDRPNQQFDPFTQALLRTVAGATGTRYSAIAHRYDGTYSAQRQELVEGAVNYRRLLAYLIGVFYRPVWRRLVDAAVLSGRIVLPRGVNRQSIYSPEFRGPTLPWIDPLKEIQAYETAVTAGFKSRYQVIRDMGGEPKTVDAQLEADSFAQPELPLEPPAPEDDDGDEDREYAAMAERVASLEAVANRAPIEGIRKDLAELERTISESSKSGSQLEHMADVATAVRAAVETVERQAPIINLPQQEPSVVNVTNEVQPTPVTMTNEAPIVNVPRQEAPMVTVTNEVQPTPVEITNNVEAGEVTVNAEVTAKVPDRRIDRLEDANGDVIGANVTTDED